MSRKLSLVAVAAASLGAAALTPTSASAWGGWGWGWGWGGPRFFVGGPAYYGYDYGGCHVRRLAPDAVGTSLAPDESLLLNLNNPIARVKGTGPSMSGPLSKFDQMEPSFIQF
jgi:hypothetical protein